jgi:AcrR family transcriptional regulator
LARRAWGDAVQNREEQFDLKRAALLTTAARLIKERGYANVSLLDIADDLHIAKPTLYHYFKSKGELLRELFAIATGAFLDPADNPDDYPLVAGLTGAEQLERFVRRAARIVVDDLGSSLVTLPANSPEMSTVASSSLGVRQMVEKIIRAGIADGSLAPCDPETSYQLVVGTLRHLPVWFADRNHSLQDVSDSVVNFVLRGLGSGAAKHRL